MRKANEAQPELGLQATLVSLEARYTDLLAQNNEYLELDHGIDGLATALIGEE